MNASKLQVEQLIVGPLATNCYLVWDDHNKEAAIIDPGDDAETILQRCAKLDLNIRYILITHGHFDHVGAVAKIKQQTNAEFLAHEADISFLEGGQQSAQRWGLSIDQPPLPNKYLKEGDTVTIGRHTLKVLHTPGHSPGGISFVHDKMVFCGDTLFQANIGRTDFRMGSFEELSHSIKTRLYTLPDDTIAYTGHGPRTQIGFEKQNNPFVHG